MNLKLWFLFGVSVCMMLSELVCKCGSLVSILFLLRGVVFGLVLSFVNSLCGWFLSVRCFLVDRSLLLVRLFQNSCVLLGQQLVIYCGLVVVLVFVVVRLSVLQLGLFLGRLMLKLSLCMLLLLCQCMVCVVCIFYGVFGLGVFWFVVCEMLLMIVIFIGVEVGLVMWQCSMVVGMFEVLVLSGISGVKVCSDIFMGRIWFVKLMLMMGYFLCSDVVLRCGSLVSWLNVYLVLVLC